MDFAKETARVVSQIPPDMIARCGDVARALGDVRASLAVFRFLREHPGIPGADRVVAGTGGSTADPRFFTDFRSTEPLAKLRAEQLDIAAKVSRRNEIRRLRTVGGVDVAYSDARGFASLIVLKAADLAVQEEVLVSRDVDFPYIPTYLAYREFPLIEVAFRRLSEPPTLLLVDGHGELHPAKCGIACMVGVKLEVPTIGVAKNPLVGTPDRRPKVGEAVPVRHEGEILGYAVRTGASIKPLYVSTGHRVAPRTAVRIVRGLCRTRIPEPVRLADAHAKDWKRRNEKSVSRFVTRSHPVEGNDP